MPQLRYSLWTFSDNENNSDGGAHAFATHVSEPHEAPDQTHVGHDNIEGRSGSSTAGAAPTAIDMGSAVEVFDPITRSALRNIRDDLTADLDSPNIQMRSWIHESHEAIIARLRAVLEAREHLIMQRQTQLQQNDINSVMGELHETVANQGAPSASNTITVSYDGNVQTLHGLHETRPTLRQTMYDHNTRRATREVDRVAAESNAIVNELDEFTEGIYEQNAEIRDDLNQIRNDTTSELDED